MSPINGSVNIDPVENRDPLLFEDCWDRFSMDVSVKNTPISPLFERSINSKPGFSGSCGITKQMINFQLVKVCMSFGVCPFNSPLVLHPEGPL